MYWGEISEYIGFFSVMSSSVNDVINISSSFFHEKNRDINRFINSNRLRHSESVTIRKCSYCGEFFAVKKRVGRPIEYCSQECRDNARLEQSRNKAHRWYHRHKHELSEKQRWGLGSGSLGQHRCDDFVREQCVVSNELSRLGLK